MPLAPSKHLRVLALGGAALLDGAAFAQGPQAQSGAQPSAPITLGEAIQRAAAVEPTLAAADAESRAAALERKDARAALLPSVVYHNQFVFTESNLTAAQTTQGGLTQSLPLFVANNSLHEYYSQGVVNETLGLAQRAAVRLADANAARAQAEAEVSRRGLTAAVTALYFRLGAAGEKTVIAQRAADEANRFVHITEQRERSREAAHADVIKARLGQQQRERERADANLAEEKARLELGVLLFADPATPYTLAAAGEPPPLPDRAGIEAAARADNPELRSALAVLQAREAEVATAQAALLPDLALNFTYGIDAPQFAKRGPDGARNLGYSASATLDIPVWDWLTTERRIREAHLRSDAAKTALTAAQRRLLADLAAFYAEADTARRELASFDASVMDARESLRLTNLRYVDGESTVLEVVDAQGTLVAAETAQSDGVVRYRLALAQLQTLTGTF